MRALFLTIGPESEPSSRFRAYQYVEPLRALGIEAEVRPRVGAGYAALTLGLRRPHPAWRVLEVAGSVAGRNLRRLRDLLDARRFDVVVLQKDTLPFGLAAVARALGLRLVYDFDDALYTPSPGRDGLGPGLRSLAERLLRRERGLAALLPRCDTVLAGSPVLADWARDHADRVTVLPTVVDTDAYPVRAVRRAGTLAIGWVGAPANARYLAPLRPVFAALATGRDVVLRLRGPEAFSCPGIPVDVRGWRSYGSRAEEAQDLADIDVGIMPLPDDRFAAGKCALKAIQYMASGLPVVASPVGANNEVVVDGETGFLARSPDEWRERLAQLLDDPELRAAMGRAGRARAERLYSLRSAAPRLARVLHETALRREATRAPARARR